MLFLMWKALQELAQELLARSTKQLDEAAFQKTKNETSRSFIYLANRCHCVQKVPESGDVRTGV